MKKALSFVGVLALFCFSPLAAQFSLKAGGGFFYASADDFAKARQSYIDLLKTYGVPYTSFFGTVHTGYDFELEALYKLTKALSFGLGVGYAKIPYSATISIPSQSYNQTNRCSAVVIPITLNIHGVIPVSSRIGFFLTAGAGLYVTTFNFEGYYDSGSGDYSSNTFKSTRAAFGVHGGAGIEVKLNATLSIVAEVLGRLAKASDFQGDWTQSESYAGTKMSASGSDQYFYYYEYQRNGVKYSNLWFDKTGPTGVLLARKGAVDLTGFSAVAAIK